MNAEIKSSEIETKSSEAETRLVTQARNLCKKLREVHKHPLCQPVWLAGEVSHNVNYEHGPRYDAELAALELTLRLDFPEAVCLLEDFVFVTGGIPWRVSYINSKWWLYYWEKNKTWCTHSELKEVAVKAFYQSALLLVEAQKYEGGRPLEQTQNKEQEKIQAAPKQQKLL